MAIRYMRLVVTAKGLACWRARIRFEKRQFDTGVRVLKRVNKSAGVRKSWQKWSERYAATNDAKEADQNNAHQCLQALTNRDENEPSSPRRPSKQSGSGSELCEEPSLFAEERAANMRESRSKFTLDRIQGTTHHGDHHRIMAGALASVVVAKKKKNKSLRPSKEDVRWGRENALDDEKCDALNSLRGADQVNTVLLNGLSSKRATVDGSRKDMIKKAVKISQIQSGIRRGASDA